jgi:hypothetical protein
LKGEFGVADLSGRLRSSDVFRLRQRRTSDSRKWRTGLPWSSVASALRGRGPVSSGTEELIDIRYESSAECPERQLRKVRSFSGTGSPSARLPVCASLVRSGPSRSRDGLAWSTGERREANGPIDGAPFWPATSSRVLASSLFRRFGVAAYLKGPPSTVYSAHKS